MIFCPFILLVQSAGSGLKPLTKSDFMSVLPLFQWHRPYGKMIFCLFLSPSAIESEWTQTQTHMMIK